MDHNIRRFSLIERIVNDLLPDDKQYSDDKTKQNMDIILKRVTPLQAEPEAIYFRKYFRKSHCFHRKWQSHDVIDPEDCPMEQGPEVEGDDADDSDPVLA